MLAMQANGSDLCTVRCLQADEETVVCCLGFRVKITHIYAFDRRVEMQREIQRLESQLELQHQNYTPAPRQNFPTVVPHSSLHEPLATPITHASGDEPTLNGLEIPQHTIHALFSLYAEGFLAILLA